jgi:hypothetical protein
MILAVVACWLAVGLLVLADSMRSLRLRDRLPRTVGFGVLALSVAPFVRALGLGFGVTAFVLTAFTATYLATLLAPWKPRPQALSVLGAAILAGVFVALT